MARVITSVCGLTMFFVGSVSMTNVLMASGFAWASPVFTWKDERGVVHYSSKPADKQAKPAQLPQIMRGEVKLNAGKAISCDQHGGVDCRAGADADGSVVCADGFKGATLRFRFTCSAPKLELADISQIDAQGKFSVFVRNEKSVVAEKPQVTLLKSDGTQVKLTGPAQIDAYGMAEFEWIPDGMTLISERPKAGELVLSCANCPS